MKNKDSTINLLTERIVIRKGHDWFDGSKYSTQISRRIRNATTYLMRHEKKPNGKSLSHSDADKWLKKNNADINSALNILRKETGEALNVLACRGCMFQPVLVTLGKPNATKARREADLLPLAA
jgi:hypothetical protein